MQITRETIAATNVAAKLPSTIATTGEVALDGASSLLCQSGTRLFAIALAHVIEIMRVLPIQTISGVPAFVRGLCIIRGAPVPVIDPAILLGEQEVEPRRLIAFRTGDRIAALAVDAVLGVWAIAPDTLNQLPSLLRDAASESIAAIGTRDSELMFVLHAARIVPEELLNRLVDEGASP